MLDPRPNSPTVSDVSQGPWALVLSHRTIDRSGALVDVLFSERRDMAAAEAFFRSAKAVTGMTPDRVTTDGHDSYPRAIRTTLGQDGVVCGRGRNPTVRADLISDAHSIS